MKVLVTGAAGYIGSILTPELLKAGHEVTALDNFMYRQNSLLECCFDKSFNMVSGDARDENLMRGFVEKADAIIPLACYTGAPLCQKDSVDASSVIIDSIKLLCKLRKPNQMIIYPNTNSGYGMGAGDTYCTEETPMRPISNYGRFKSEAEKILLDSGNVVVFRLATVFGASPRMRLDLLVNDFTYRAYNDRFIVLFESKFKRNYIHVRDVARAFLFAIDHFDKLKGQAYNLGLSNANLNKKELCEEIKKQLPDFFYTEAELFEDPDKRNYIVSNEKIEKAGFKAKTSVSEGISELLKAYKILHRTEYYNY
jgi:nucleoside-diphosphate-sugar epimerase